MEEEAKTRKYRILQKNMCPDDCGEELLMYIPEYYNDYTGTWTKICKCIKKKEKQYFWDFDEARAACKEHARKQSKVIWSETL